MAQEFRFARAPGTHQSSSCMSIRNTQHRLNPTAPEACGLSSSSDERDAHPFSGRDSPPSSDGSDREGLPCRLRNRSMEFDHSPKAGRQETNPMADRTPEKEPSVRRALTVASRARWRVALILLGAILVVAGISLTTSATQRGSLQALDYWRGNGKQGAARTWLERRRLHRRKQMEALGLPKEGSAGVKSSTLGFRSSRFQVSTLTMDPSRRRTGLPLQAHQWGPENVFVINTAGPGEGYWRSHTDLDSLLKLVGMRYTQVMRPTSQDVNFLSRYAPMWPKDPEKLLPWFQLQYAMAHIEIWAHMVEKKLPFALIFEDDARVSVNPESFRQHLEKVLRQLNFLIIRNGNKFFFDLLYLARRAYNPYTEPQLTANIVQAGVGPSQGSHAYLISYAGAKKLLSTGNLDRPIAELLTSIPHRVLLSADPHLFFSKMYQCKGVACRKTSLEGKSRLPLTAACNGTMFVELPGHPWVNQTLVPTDWKRLASAGTPTVDQGYLPQGGRACGTVAQCLIKHRLGALRPPVVAASLAPPIQLPLRLSMWKTYVISLAGDTQRFQLLQAQLAPAGFGAVTRALALNVSDTDMAVFSEVVEREHRSHTRNHRLWASGKATPELKVLSKGEVGCALSHYLVWLEVVARKLPYALVLEDDLRLLTKSFREDFERNVQELKDLLALDPRVPDVVLVGREGASPEQYYTKLTEHVWYSPLAWSSYAYIVSLQGAKKLVDKFLVDDPLDALWFRVPGMVFFSFEPPLTGHMSQANGAGRQTFASRVRDSDRSW